MSKIKFILPIVLVLLGGVYKFVLAKPAPVPKHKIAGEIYILQKDFLINLQGGRFAKLNAALVLKEGYSAAPAAGHGGAAATPPTGYGEMPQEAVIRSIITDTLTDSTAERLQREKSRLRLQKAILKRITTQTDVEAEDVLFTDVAIQ
ncbi:MAG: flagellar basal body-associated FliL family protein [Conexibacter sp.]|nr:flagellar basal body-associated FliL family protein [Conexibacter sp.]